ncbi:MAG: hypothetical protein OXG27_03340 [Chloroflexi bacterium]|nr:hypothetical protein [Chloroflexota bacterium]
MTLADGLRTLSIEHRDDVAIAVSDRLSADVAARLARKITERLSAAAVPRSQRTWIIATRGDDEAAASTASAISDHIDGARLVVHDSREPDGLTFQRRIPGQRRGGIYLNHAWQSASVRIACGEPRRVLFGLCGWFNRPARLRQEDLNADLVLRD